MCIHGVCECWLQHATRHWPGQEQRTANSIRIWRHFFRCMEFDITDGAAYEPEGNIGRGETPSHHATNRRLVVCFN